MQTDVSSKPKVYPFKSVCNISEPKRLAYILNVSLEKLRLAAIDVNKYYYVKKLTNKGKVRKLHVPTGDLKVIQERIQKRILSKVQLPDCMYGSVKDRDIKANARIHINQNVVVAVDIKKCFPNTDNSMVCKSIMSTFRYPNHIGGFLTRLLTINRQVPQGSPTSSTLVNIVLSPLCLRIMEYTKNNKLKLSVWVDDIIFSGIDADKHITPITRIISDFGFSISNRKVKVMRKNKIQEVTGIQVKNRLSISKIKIEKYTDEIYYFFKNKAIDETLKENAILGKIEHVSSVNKKQGIRLLNIFKQLSMH
ncbi:MAG: reverse transcriptase family protein [Microgenomates group bacterium]